MWFDNWEHDLVELGFAVCDPTTGVALKMPTSAGGYEDRSDAIGNKLLVDVLQALFKIEVDILQSTEEMI